MTNNDLQQIEQRMQELDAERRRLVIRRYQVEIEDSDEALAVAPVWCVLNVYLINARMQEVEVLATRKSLDYAVSQVIMRAGGLDSVEDWQVRANFSLEDDRKYKSLRTSIMTTDGVEHFFEVTPALSEYEALRTEKGADNV